MFAEKLHLQIKAVLFDLINTVQLFIKEKIMVNVFLNLLKNYSCNLEIDKH